MDRNLRQLSPGDVGTATDRLDIEGENVLVTGAGNGMGRVVAITFAAAGANLAISDRLVDDLQAVEAEITDHFDVEVTAIGADISDPDAIADMVATAVDDLGGLDVLLNIAGVSTVGDSKDITTKQWDLVHDVDLRGTFLASREAYPHLRGGGRIVNISSIAGIYGASTMSHYGAAKAGVKNLTRSLGSEWAGENIRVNAVAPGPILTTGVAAWFDMDPEEAYDRSHVDRGVGSPAEIADTVLFLASPMSSFVTGETITVAGPPAVQEDVSAAPE